MDHLIRIEQLDMQLQQLDRMLKQGEHVGAGLSLTLGVGPASDDVDPVLQLDVTHNTQELLELLRDSLQQARALRVQMARQDFNKLKGFFDDESASGTWPTR